MGSFKRVPTNFQPSAPAPTRPTLPPSALRPEQPLSPVQPDTRPDPKFKIGDVVSLPSGSRPMTVIDVRPTASMYGAEYACGWMTDGVYHTAEFPEAALVGDSANRALPERLPERLPDFK